MGTDTHGDRLIARLMRCESVDEARDLTQVCEVLATDPTGAPAPYERRQGARELLRGYEKKGVIAFDKIGRRQQQLTPSPLNSPYVFRLGSAETERVETLEEEVRRERERQRGSAPVQEVPVFGIAPGELAKVREMLQAAGYWNRWADAWCGTGEAVGGTVGGTVGGAVGGENTHMSLDGFRVRYGKHYTGSKTRKGEYSIEPLIKNGDRERKDGTAPPYAAIFNADGTINGPLFERIAKERGEWREDAGGVALQAIPWPSVRRVHKIP